MNVANDLPKGVTAFQSGDYAAAERHFANVLAADPHHVGALNLMGATLAALKRFEEAEPYIRRGISLGPASVPAYCNHGLVLTALARLPEAIEQYSRALALAPDDPAVRSVLAEAWLARGHELSKLYCHQEAAFAYHEVFTLKPDLAGIEGWRLHGKELVCDWSNFDAEVKHLTDSIRAGKAAAFPFSFITLTDNPEDHLRCARAWALPASSPRPSTQHDKIRIGYISADFKRHATAYLVAELFELHDRTTTSVTAFSLGQNDGSPIRARIVAGCDQFVDCHGLAAETAALAVTDREIDILIDLHGFTDRGLYKVFASRPAPIQVSYLGYPGTMGAPYYDYIIGDGTVFGPGDDVHYSEKLVRLPGSYQPNDRQRRISQRPVSHQECGLPREGFVFCCFNNHYKILPDVFDSWMRILTRVEGSVLWLLVNYAPARDNLRRESAARGVDPGRIVFADRLEETEHLARQRLAGLFLDTLPYNAHTTASDALWVGLPVLTRKGHAFAGRVAASLLNAMGLPELVTHSAQDYEAVAIELATNPAKLAAVKSKLNANRATAPLFDTPRYARDLEAAYDIMIDRHRRGLPPDHIEVGWARDLGRIA